MPGRILHPPCTDSPPRTGSEVKALCHVEQLVRRVGGGVLHARRRRREDLEDVPTRVQPSASTLPKSSRETASATLAPAVLSMKAMTAVGSLAPKVTKATSCARISREKLHKPRRCDPMVTEDLVADPDHISPAIRRLLRLGVGETPSGT